MLLFIVQMVIILLLIETIFVIIKKIFHGRMSVALIPLLLVVVNFVSESSLELIHISLIINIRPRISHLYGLCDAAAANENCFHCFCQQNKSAASKLKFRHRGNYLKRIPEAVNLAYTNDWNLVRVTFGELLRLFSGKVNLLYLLYSML